MTTPVETIITRLCQRDLIPATEQTYTEALYWVDFVGVQAGQVFLTEEQLHILETTAFC